jgi:phage terminase large subunit-like protein
VGYDKTYDANGNIQPDKKKSEERIDGIVASIMALGVAIETEYHGSLAGNWDCTVIRWGSNIS